jgi:hypothetical protein
LASGEDIWLVELLQYQTYRGLIDGYPTHGLNKALIAQAISTAKSKQFGSKAPHLFSPVETTADVPDEPFCDEDWLRAKLPSITCIASFKSFTVQDPDETHSFAVVIWFQDEFALPIDPTILDVLRRLDWKSIAVDASD